MYMTSLHCPSSSSFSSFLPKIQAFVCPSSILLYVCCLKCVFRCCFDHFEVCPNNNCNHWLTCDCSSLKGMLPTCLLSPIANNQLVSCPSVGRPVGRSESNFSLTNTIRVRSRTSLLLMIGNRERKSSFYLVVPREYQCNRVLSHSIPPANRISPLLTSISMNHRQLNTQ